MVQPLKIQPFNFYSLRDFSQPADAQHSQPIFKSLTPTIKEEAPEAPPPPPPPPTFSEAELAHAREQGRMDGHAQGLQEGMEKARSADAERDTVLSSQLRNISVQLETLREEHRSLLEARRAEAVRLGMTIAGMVATRALQQYPTSIAEDLVNTCLPLLIDEPKLTLTTHPAITEAMRQKTTALAHECQFEGTLVIEPSASLSLTECRLSWAQGEATRSQEDVWQEILQRLLPQEICAQMPTLQAYSELFPVEKPEIIHEDAPAQEIPSQAAPEKDEDLDLSAYAPTSNVPSFGADAPTAHANMPSDEIDEFAAYAPEYRIAREDENPIVQDILHTIEEVEQEQERKKPPRKRTPPTPTEEM